MVKNSEGFTLIEILAVVVILGLLTTIAVPAITDKINQSKQKTFVEDAQTIVATVKDSYLSAGEHLDGVRTDENNPNLLTYDKSVIQDLLSKKAVSSFGTEFKYLKVVVVKSDSKYAFNICMIDEDGYGFTLTDSSKINTDSIRHDLSNKDCQGDSIVSDNGSSSEPGSPSGSGGVTSTKLNGKKLILIGDSSGIPAAAMEEVLQNSGAQVVFSATECFVCSAAGQMNLVNQQRVKDASTQYGVNTVVILGSADAEAAEIFAETVTVGDPTFSGPLTGVSLNLPVYHILDPIIRSCADESKWDQQIALMEMVLDVDEIVNAVKDMRNQHSHNTLD